MLFGQIKAGGRRVEGGDHVQRPVQGHIRRLGVIGVGEFADTHQVGDGYDALPVAELFRGFKDRQFIQSIAAGCRDAQVIGATWADGIAKIIDFHRPGVEGRRGHPFDVDGVALRAPPDLLGCHVDAVGQQISERAFAVGNAPDQFQHGVVVAPLEVQAVGLFFTENAALVQLHAESHDAAQVDGVQAVTIGQVIALENGGYVVDPQP